MAAGWELQWLSDSRSIKKDEQPVIPDKIGLLLHFASQGDVEAVTRLLDEGLDGDQADYDGRTAMHLAASEGHVGVIQLLLKRGADVNPVDRWTDTPLANAMRYNYTEVCQILVNHGGKIVNKGMTPPSAWTADFEIDPDELELENGTPIGRGAYGEVRKVNWRGTWVAAKTVLHRHSTNQQIEQEFIDELALLQKVRHPNIVQFLGAVTKSTPIVIVTEYLPRGDLEEILTRRGRIPAREAVQFALDIARGMNYLHQHKPDPIVHRDLKPRNLLQDEAGHLKVADFGLSKLFQEGYVRYAMTGETGSCHEGLATMVTAPWSADGLYIVVQAIICGVFKDLFSREDRYMAPEVYLHRPYDKSVDIFSFGIIVQEMFEGSPSKTRLPHEVALDRACADVRPMFSAKHYPPEMKDLIRQCWDGNPKLRPSFTQIIRRLEDIQMNLKRSFWTTMPIYYAVTNFHSSIINLHSTWHRCIQHNNTSTSSLTMEKKNGSGGSVRGGRSTFLSSNRAVLPE